MVKNGGEFCDTCGRGPFQRMSSHKAKMHSGEECSFCDFKSNLKVKKKNLYTVLFFAILSFQHVMNKHMVDSHSEHQQNMETDQQRGKSDESDKEKRMFPSKTLDLTNIPYPEMNDLVRISFYRDHVAQNLRTR